LPIGSEIAAYTPDDNVGGACRWGSVPAEMKAYYSDSGFDVGNRLAFRVWDIEADEEYELEADYIEGDNIFRIDGRSVVRLGFDFADHQIVELLGGWNLSSIFIDPNRPAVSEVLKNIFEADNLIIVKDNEGEFWWPRYGYNGLGDWNVLSAYQIKIREADEFEAIGMRIEPDTPIQLNAGWNMISYLLDDPVDCEIALEGIIEHLVIAKDVNGDFFVPEYDYNGVGDMSPTFGYKLYMLENVELVYNPGERNRGFGQRRLSHDVIHTGSDMSVLIIDMDIELVMSGIEVVVLAGNDDREVGRAFVNDIPCGITIRGDDLTTETLDGARAREQLRIVIGSDAEKLRYEIVSGGMLYQENGFTVLKLSSMAADELPQEFLIESIYPNPFNSSTQVRFGIPEEGLIRVSVFDLSGRKVHELPTIKYQAGWHSVNIDGEGWTSGIYMIRINSNTGTLTRKLVMLR
ncbi:MAG: T9SS type A sorting domain-containing protein, partial [Calditrichaeota bacterium]|nr:T9SS type A sorting domain-containing protein [Calditrichota bacterium]